MGRGVWVVSGSRKGPEGCANLDELVILRNENQTLLSIWISAAVFNGVIVDPDTLKLVTISFFLKNAIAPSIFYIYLT